MIFSTEQKDAITELVNIGVGRAAASLNELVETHVVLTVPHVQAIAAAEIGGELHDILDSDVSSVQQAFSGALDGFALLVFPPASAAELVSVVTQDDGEPMDLDSIRVGTLSEVGNILINGVIGVISNVLRKPLKFNLPTYAEAPIRTILADTCGLRSPAGNTVLLARTRFSIEQFEIEGSILLLFELGSFDSFIAALDREWIKAESVIE
jgi:chemotaxis protein CheC